ncbi:hypothetical protein UFOVP28_44 [uncultured Caudovirales phage]|uniref:Uncharacterized protein n=1 Tax=uncultured Caudovirales phage TaxID=2100421 RepID=A0A6J5KNJ0_9CAUD|nr:hypothetical protein UFOVP28_44 [uncultured Caudovirales phage]
MSTSGTTSYSPQLVDIIEEAYERAGYEIRSGYEFRTAIRSLNFLLMEWANKGLNLWAIDQGTLTLSAGTSSYTLPADTIDTIEHQIRLTTGSGGQTDLFVEKITVSQWAQIPNKLTTGRPINCYVQRLVAAPVINFWPQPDQAYTFVYWRLRRLQDAGGAINTPDVPFRFVVALTAGLAYQIGVKKGADLQRVQGLKLMYDEAWQMAADEDRDRSSFFFIPYVG